MQKKIIFSIFLFIATTSILCFSQNGDGVYQLGYYRIDPNNRVVYGQEMIGGSEVQENGSIVHWDGIQYIPFSKIDYDQTSLILFGNFFTFKEYFHSKCNMHQAKILRSEIGKDFDLIVMDKKKLYVFYDQKESSTLDISKYKHITDCVFQDKAGKIYFLRDTQDEAFTELTQIENLDLGSLRHIVNNYYMDNNGLYFFGTETSSMTGGVTTKWNDSGILEQSNGRNITPIVSDSYFIYDDAVYSTKDQYKVNKLLLDGKKLHELHFADNYVSSDDKDYYITDGERIYRYWGTSWSWEETNLDDLFGSGKIDDQPQKWEYLGMLLLGHNSSSKGSYYYPSVDKPSGSGFHARLYHSDDGFYTIQKTSSLQKPVATKRDSIFIRNYDTKQYELLDVDQYTPISSRMYMSTNWYIYKNRLYSEDCLPIVEDIDLDKLERIKYRNQQTNFFSDGKILFHEENLLRTTAHEKDGDQYLKFEQPLYKNVDWKTLKIINENLLVDKNNIYYGYHNGLEIIPIRNLEMRVVIFTDSEKIR